MTIVFRKGGDGPSSMRCVRDDGTETWMASANNGEYFVHHDLLHYVVETVLGIESAFGIRDIEADPMPLEASAVEEIVGLVQLGVEPEQLTREQYAQIVSRWTEHRARWAALANGESMTLEFPPN